MKRVICNDWDSADFSEQFSFDGKQIHIPKRYIDRPGTRFLFKIEDTEGNLLLRPTYLNGDTIDTLSRYLPSWGLKIVKNIASVPNVWVVDYIETGL